MDGAADERLEQQLRGGEDDVLGALFESYRARLTRMVTFRLDPRLVGRIDADDVLQDAFVEAEKRLGAFRGDDKPFLVWIRLITQQTMVDLHRRHLGAGKRSAECTCTLKISITTLKISIATLKISIATLEIKPTPEEEAQQYT